MMESARWAIDVSVEPSGNEREYLVVISLDGPGGSAFHTLPLMEEEAHELDAKLRQAFDRIRRKHGRSVRPRSAVEKVANGINGSGSAAVAVVSSVTDGNRECVKCLGSGKIADDSGGAPWSCWEALPAESSVAVNLGLVKPIACPACGGKGGR